MKLTNEEWDKLPREEKKEALIDFKEPDNIHRPDRVDNRKFQQEKI